jgi:DNA-binding winged helix-turn-helix (wHTH) protein
MRFGSFTLTVETRQLTRDGRDVRLAPKAFDLLAALVLARPRVLSKAVLQERLWPSTFVAEANLSNLMSEVREALGEDPRAPAFIRTVHGIGYAFCGEAVTIARRARSGTGLRFCWLAWGRRRYRLSPGDNIIGRDGDAHISLDAATLSRRHARVAVDEQGAVLEDVGSKNGTFRGDARVVAPVRLADGDVIRMGAVQLTFHVNQRSLSTETEVRDLP